MKKPGDREGSPGRKPFRILQGLGRGRSLGNLETLLFDLIESDACLDVAAGFRDAKPAPAVTTEDHIASALLGLNEKVPVNRHSFEARPFRRLRHE